MGDTRKAFQSVLVVAGILISAYAYYVETSKERNSQYRALCDINERVSCSKVFTSRWGRGMGLFDKDSIFTQPNSVYGIISYLTLILLEMLPASSLICAAQIGVMVCANLASVWLSYILFYVLEDVCVVCISMYVINFSLLVTAYLRYRGLKTSSIDSRKKRS